MATATPPARTDALDPVVAHPLDRLRGTIRRYVVLDGLLSAAVFLAGWFAVAMAVDFGLFKLLTWDWVLDAPGWLRAAGLALTLFLLAGTVVYRVARRLTTELSYPSLALLLERRFPQVFGDRLITAVQLADVPGQARYGYSADLIRQTIDEARERVGTVPVNDVFNWRRLWVMGFVAAGLVLVVAAVGFAGHIAATGGADPYRFGWRFAHVAGTFVERDVLLQNTPWPRRAHLEFVGFDADDRRIGKDAPDPVVRAKAFRWVVADRAAPMGWRPMLWGDLNEGLVGGPVPPLPADAFRAATGPGAFAGEPTTWTLDQVQAVGIDDPNTRAKLNGTLHTDAYLGLQNGLDRVFTALDEKAADPRMGRRLRKLDVPGKVTLVYSGASKSGDITLSPQQDQEFAAPVSDLKESVRFVVRAEDFRTGSKGITLVPPPLFTKLTRTEDQPAYLHHAPPQDEGYPALKGLRQRMADKPLSLTGDRSFFTVPSGTELTLTATTDTDLTAAYLVPKVGLLPGAWPGSAEPVPVPVGVDKRTVSVPFRGDYRLAAGRTLTFLEPDADGAVVELAVTTTPTLEFDLVVEQADGVRAKRQLFIQIADDAPPVVEVQISPVIRKVGPVYYVTPVARLPFDPESVIKDDHGLSKVAYEFSYWPEEGDGARAVRGVTVAGLFRPVPAWAGPLPGLLPGPSYQSLTVLDRGGAKQTGSFLLQRYEDRKNELRRETRATFEATLNRPADETAAQAVKSVELKSQEVDFFDLKALKLATAAGEVQPRFRLDLNVVATDTNYDGGPKTGQMADPIRLLLVSEGDLLAEINKDEEKMIQRLDDALAKLGAARRKWEFVKTQTSIGMGTNSRDQLDTVRVRATDAAQDVGKAFDAVQEVVRKYRDLHRECVVNQVTEVTRDRFGLFANKLDRVAGENPAAVTEREGQMAAAGQLTPKMTFPAASKSVDGVIEPMAGGRWAESAATQAAGQALAVLEQEVKALRDELGEIGTREKLKGMIAAVIAEQKRISKEFERLKERSGERLRSKEPELGPAGPLFVAKGEAKVVKQGIQWLQFDKDELTVKVAVLTKDGQPAPADALGVPAELKLNFERNQLDFEYTVKAGSAEGEFLVTLTPEVGLPVQVVVTVK